MPAKPSSYLVQLRDQIAKTFDLEELRALAFDLQLDWDELEGIRKTNRIQDLIIQLARNGRLEELIESLKEYRPKAAWPKMPTAEQQKQDIRTAFPKKSLFQTSWFIGLIITFILAGIFALLLFQFQIPQRTINQLVRPFPSEQEDETLIVIATFYRTEGVVDVAAHYEIRNAIQGKIDELNLENVRVELEPTSIESSDRAQAEATGKRYNASLIIWGADTGIRQEINFLNLKGPYLFAADITITETEKTQLAQPEAYAQFVTEELPGQLTYLSFYALGQAEYIRSNYDQAIEYVKTAITTLPNTSQLNTSELALDTAYYGLGWMYQITGRMTSALEAYTQAITINPQYAKAFTNRGNVYGELDEFEKAIADYDKSISLNPEDSIVVVALNNRGLAYLGQGQFDAAISDFTQAIELDPQDADLFNNRGITYIQMGMYDQAIADFDQAIVLNSQDAVSFYNRGLAYHDQGMLQLAIANHNQAISLDNQYVDALIDRGNTYDKLGEYDLGIADYNQAIEVDPQNANAYFNRGIAREDQGDYIKAMSDYDQAIALDSEFALAFQYRGNLHDELGQYEQALTDYNRAIVLNPEDANAFFNRGLAYLKHGDNAQAINDYNQAIALNPELAIAYYSRGLSYFYQEKYEQALADFHYYLELEPNPPDRETLDNFIIELEARVEE
jgi:tetratricopeptide (TPR) repeat protein